MKENISSLFGLIKKDKAIINQLLKTLSDLQEKLSENPEEEMLKVYTAYSIHNLYTAFETIFKNIASVFENNIKETSHFHYELLRKMNTEVYKMRPAVISDESFGLLDELRQFRHRFRHAYDYSLNSDKLLMLMKMIFKSKEYLLNDLKSFNLFLDETLKRLEG